MMSTLSENQLLRVGGCVRNKLLLQFSHSLLLLILKSPLCKLHVRLTCISTSPRCLYPLGNSSQKSSYTWVEELPEAHQPLLPTVSKSLCQTFQPKNGTATFLAHHSLTPPFDRTGVDFAGPFLIHRGNPRKPEGLRCCFCVFYHQSSAPGALLRLASWPTYTDSVLNEALPNTYSQIMAPIS